MVVARAEMIRHLEARDRQKPAHQRSLVVAPQAGDRAQGADEGLLDDVLDLGASAAKLKCHIPVYRSQSFLEQSLKGLPVAAARRADEFIHWLGRASKKSEDKGRGLRSRSGSLDWPGHAGRHTPA